MKKLMGLILVIMVVLVLVAGCNSEGKDSKELSITETAAVNETQQTSESIATTVNEETSTISETTTTEKVADQTSEATLSDEEKAKLFPTDFELSNGKGEMISLADHKGKLLFLNFFTTWCGFCMDEMPEFQKAYEKYGDDLQIIIVDVNFDPGEKSIEEVVKWYDDGGYTFPMVIDEDGVKTEAFYPYIQGYPTTFVYGPDGGFIGYLSGALDEATIAQIVEQYKAK
ncbi:MAG: TlpA family protein disulfide reductase [Vallitaleaceae bacterium]|nr:TlpA family protein disulfide reductase [Vallitaleaceae bacterium]